MRKSKGTKDNKNKAKKDSSKETPKDSRAKKKEPARPKKASEPKGKTPTGRGASRPSKGKHQDQEVEVVGEFEDPSEDLIEFYKKSNWEGVAPGTWFYKYEAP